MSKINSIINCFFIFSLVLIVNEASAQIAKQQKVFASIHSTDKNETEYITIPANINYPSILQGNESQSLDYIEKFAKNRAAYITQIFVKSKKYFPRVTKILSKYGLSKEYQVLLPLESGFNGNAISSAGAVGFWQIMDEVAKEYGLQYIPQLTDVEKIKLAAEAKQNINTKVITLNKNIKKIAPKDDRKNFIKSTLTAAKYLKDRTRNLNNNTLLIVASYNCGVGNVWEAKRKTGLLDPTFWDIKKYLPAETQAYVMNFITLNVLFHNYQKFANGSLTFKPKYEKVLLNATSLQNETAFKITD